MTPGQILFEAYQAEIGPRRQRLAEAAGLQLDPRSPQQGTSWEALNDVQRELWEATAQRFQTWLISVLGSLWEVALDERALAAYSAAAELEDGVAAVVELVKAQRVAGLLERIQEHKTAIEAAGPIHTADTIAAGAKHAADAELWSVLELGA